MIEALLIAILVTQWVHWFLATDDFKRWRMHRKQEASKRRARR